jgi:hypothetical protein
MSDTTINTSRAKRVTVDIYDYDNLPLALTYKTGGVAIDLTDYKFEFFLKDGNQQIENYVIEAGDLSTSHLSKTGTGLNVLNMEGMFEDIRDNQVVAGGKYELVQVVTDDNGIPYAHIIYSVNAKQY